MIRKSLAGLVRIGVIAALCAMASTLSFADTTIASNDASVSSTGVCLGGPNCGNSNLAVGFTAGGNFNVTSIGIWLDGHGDLYYSTTTDAYVSLTTAADQFTPGTVLGTWHVTNLPNNNAVGETTITGITGITLVAGQQYFLEASPGSGCVYTCNAWMDGSGASANTVTYVGEYGGTWSNFSGDNLAYEVDGTAVTAPEPSSMLLLFSGLAGLGGLIRRRR